MDSDVVRVRFAPSPTGYLHIGGARTALFNWLLARHSPGGRFVLRIEDTDRSRHVGDSVGKILDDLRWLGLDWDEGPEKGGDFGPYFQSKRLGLYQEHVQRLLDEGKAYYALETPEELSAMRAAAQGKAGGFKYPRPDPLPTVAEGEAARASGRPVVVRLRMPGQDITVADEILGEVTVTSAELEDFVIQKGDGWPTYHLACVVDDALMRISHVLRGQEHLMNTPKHLALQEALGLATPRYAHLPIIFNQNGSKMSKRDKYLAVKRRLGLLMSEAQRGDLMAQELLTNAAAACGGQDVVTGDASVLQGDVLQTAAKKLLMTLPEIEVHDFRAAGYLPEALLNFISLLGWSTGDDVEQLTLRETAARFDLGAIGKGNAKFDRDKLLSFNTDWAARVDSARLLAAFKDYLAVNDSLLMGLEDQQLSYALRVTKGFRTFRDAESKVWIAFITNNKDVKLTDKKVRKAFEKNDGQGFDVLERALSRFESLSSWDEDSVRGVLQTIADEMGLKFGSVAQPIRAAITGGEVSPGICETLVMLTRKNAIPRVRKALASRQIGSENE